MCKEFASVLQAGFFDYAAMLSEIRKPEETAAAIGIMKDVLTLLESTQNSDIDFVDNVVGDIQSMIGIARQEAGQDSTNRVPGSGNEMFNSTKEDPGNSNVNDNSKEVERW